MSQRREKKVSREAALSIESGVDGSTLEDIAADMRNEVMWLARLVTALHGDLAGDSDVQSLRRGVVALVALADKVTHLRAVPAKESA